MTRKACPPCSSASASSKRDPGRACGCPRRGLAQVAAEEVQREGVTLHVLDQLLELFQSVRPSAPDVSRRQPSPRPLEQRDAARGKGASSRFSSSARRSGMLYRVVTTHSHGCCAASPFSSAAIALVLQLARRGRGGRVLQRLEAIEDEQRPPLADEPASRRPLSNAPAALPASRRVAEEGEGLVEKQVGRSRQLLARPLAVERPRKHGLAPRPVLNARSAAHFATSEVFPSPPSATKVRMWGRFVSPRTTWSHASSRSFVSASRPIRSDGAYFMMREMSTRKTPEAIEVLSPTIASSSTILALASSIC